MNLTELTKELKSFKSASEAKTKSAVEQTFKEFFAKFPEVARLQWTQYTPYFNDGEACVFGMGDIQVILTQEGREQFGIKSETENGEDEDDNDDDDDLDLLRGEWDRESRSYKSISPRSGELVDAIRVVEEGLEGIKSYLEAIYGDHVLVKVYRDGKSVVDDRTDHD